MRSKVCKMLFLKFSPKQGLKNTAFVRKPTQKNEARQDMQEKTDIQNIGSNTYKRK
jgi:hypothetical protein